MAIKGVFFDLNGTLLVYGDMDSELSEWYSEFYSRLQKHGLTVSRDFFTLRCNNAMTFDEVTFNTHDELTIFERRIKSLCTSFEITVETGEIKNIASALVDIWAKHLLPDPDCISVLEMLRQDKILALISNFDHPPYVYNALNNTGLAEFFPTVVISGEVGINKPHPGIYTLTLEKTGLLPEEVIYVGDTEDDVRGALSAGITPVLIYRKQTDSEGRTEYSTDKNPVVPPVPDVSNLTDVRVITSLLELNDIID